MFQLLGKCIEQLTLENDIESNSCYTFGKVAVWLLLFNRLHTVRVCAVCTVHHMRSSNPLSIFWPLF